MASIKMTADDFNAIVKACKPFVAKKSMRPETESIHLSCDRHTVTALALDGVKALKLTVQAVDDSDDCYIPMPVVKPVKAKETPFVEIVSDDKNISIITSTGTQIYPAEINLPVLIQSMRERMFAKDEPVKSVYFDPKQLADALGSLDAPCVRIDYYGEVRPIEFYAVTDNALTRGIVLPMRTNDTRLKEARDAR